MLFDGIKSKIEEYQQQGKKLFATSSFQTHSIPMLHIISRIDNSIPIYYLNTGYLFPKTIAFKDKIAADFGLNILGVSSPIPKSQQLDEKGNLLYSTDPDYCCHLNKVLPMEPLLASNDVWINGVRADQNINRSNLKDEEAAPNGVTRFHPMLDWSGKMIFDYIREHNLPKNPLDDEGYVSIGCEPCTRKYDLGDERQGRWFGLNKNECGLHTDLVKK